jgi:hypothetical protein
LKARENPFRIERVHQLRFRFSTGTMADLLATLARNNWQGAIIGPHGSGKSTLLAELQAELRRLGHRVHPIRFTEADRETRASALATWLQCGGEDAMLILDGAEQLTRREWKAVRLAAAGHRGLIVTSHRPGFLSTIYHCRTSASLLRELVQELLEADSKTASLDALFRGHEGNIRNCLRDLYDQSDRRS